MTNFAMIFTVWSNLITNPVPAGVTTNGQNYYQISSVSRIEQYMPDGGLMMCSTMAHFGYKTNVSAVGRVRPTLPIPRSSTLFQFSPQIANGGTDNLENFCPMFKVWFTTNTNWIYGLEMTTNFSNWALCPPEIDGTGSSEYFFDVLTNGRSYRIASRAGVLPE